MIVYPSCVSKDLGNTLYKYTYLPSLEFLKHKYANLEQPLWPVCTIRIFWGEYFPGVFLYMPQNLNFHFLTKDRGRIPNQEIQCNTYRKSQTKRISASSADGGDIWKAVAKGNNAMFPDILDIRLTDFECNIQDLGVIITEKTRVETGTLIPSTMTQVGLSLPLLRSCRCGHPCLLWSMWTPINAN